MGMTDHRGHLRLHVDSVGDEPFHRDPAEVGEPQGRQPEVRALAQSADDRAAGIHRYETSVDGWVFEVSVEDEPRALLREKAGQGAGAGRRKGSDTIRAQIPGRVVRLWVEVGDVVETGQRLLAIEAMKMENEVRAPHAGTIEHIAVEPGGSVELRDELLRLA
jgi:biotin carboxyl carrier protein